MEEAETYDIGLDDVATDPRSPYSRQASAMTQSSRRMRLNRLGRSMKNSVADFFGVGEEQAEIQEKWKQRSRNLAKKSVVGGLKPGAPSLTRSGTVDSVFVDSAGTPAPFTPCSAGIGLHGHPLAASFHARPTPTPIDPLHRSGRQYSQPGRAFPMRQLSRQISTASSSRRSMRTQTFRRTRKDSVVKMAYDGVKTLMTPTRKSTRRRPYLRSRSFAPASISSCQDDGDTLKFRRQQSEILSQLAGESGPAAAASRLKVEPQLLRPQLSWMSHMSYMSYMSHLSQGYSELSQSPAADSVFAEDAVLDDVFFDCPTAGSPLVQPYSGPPPLLAGFSADTPQIPEEDTPPPDQALPTLWESGQQQQPQAVSDEEDHRGENGKMEEMEPLQSRRGKLTRQMAVRHDSDEDKKSSGTPGRWMAVTQMSRPVKPGWNIGRQKALPTPPAAPIIIPPTPESLLDGEEEDEIDGIPFTPMARLPEDVMNQLTENLNRREIGKGMVGRLFKRSYRRDRIDSDIKAQLDEIVDHRPYFTYWVTFVQVVIYTISVFVYGIAPVGFEETLITEEVMMPNLALEEKSYYEKDNFWIGPRQADLIHLGAKYSPCMRKDENIEGAILDDHRKENETACCIRNDGSGCVQTSRKKCSKTLSTWEKWTKKDDRMSGSVCGLDPVNCDSPHSRGAFTWKDDITTWPICKNASKVGKGNKELNHLTCEVVGRPCCVGIQGECIITTREYCEFRRGYFHEEASLCSQISCMNEICGMMPFLEPDRPDQFYRLWTSLFLHAGLLQLVVTVLFQFLVMRDLEKLAGWLRIAIIYLGSGIAGSLSSAIFLPYHVEAGPAGSQFGLLACLIVEVIQNWYILQNPLRSVGKLLCIVGFLFVIGLLPMVDNYAHLVGFIFGIFLSFALLPYVTFGRYDRKRKIIGIILCLFTATGVLALLVVLFYVVGVYTCPNCQYFNCIPFKPKFCKSMEVKIGRSEIY